MWYNLYEIATGTLISSGSVLFTTSDPNRAVKETADHIGIWNTSTLDYDPYPPQTRIDTGDFFDLFTQPELEALLLKAKTSDAAAVFLKRLDLKDSVDRVDPLLIADMNRMVVASVLTVARKDEILSV